MRGPKRILLWLFAAGAALGGIAFTINVWQRAMVGPQHAFVIEGSPKFLTEQLAMTKARETLALDLADHESWQPFPDGRTADPDGNRDEYLSRNTLNPNSGSTQFRRLNLPGVRFVNIELIGDRMVCRLSRGK